MYLTSDDINGVASYGTSYIKNYKVPGTPHRGYSFGIEHRDPKYWWISANGNYLTHNYLDISPILRTNNFYINPDDPDGFPFPEANEADARTLLKQERFDNIFLLLSHINILKFFLIKVIKIIFFTLLNLEYLMILILKSK